MRKSRIDCTALWDAAARYAGATLRWRARMRLARTAEEWALAQAQEARDHA